MAEKGVILIAVGNKSYAHWAVNMAVSIKYHNPLLPIAILVDAITEKVFTEKEKRFFSHIIPVEPSHLLSKGKFAPGLLKLNMYSYSPFEKTIFLDVDGITIKPLDGLFAMCDGKHIASQVNATCTDADESWPCQWMSLSDTKKYYGLEKFTMPEVNSSFFYFEKSEKAKEYFDFAKGNFIHGYKTLWGNSFPDELALNVAAAQSKLDISISEDENVPVIFRPADTQISKWNENIYVIGLYGEKSNQFRKSYEMYDRLIGIYSNAVLGHSAGHKCGQLMGHKFMLSGRMLRNKSWAIPEKEVAHG